VTGNAFTNEIERAVARPDVQELRQVLAEYFAWHQADRQNQSSEHLPIDPIIYDPSDADRSLALVALAMTEYDDPAFLGLVAAGPLEDILVFRPYSEELAQRILDEARKTARFRWMLSGVWLPAIDSAYADVLTEAIGDMSMDRGDALPEKPWA
jgi:hypothetical protein